jgi:hypothetical protein
MGAHPFEKSPFSVKWARVAALLFLLLTPLAPFGIEYVPSALVAPGDMATTANNILASESLFRLGIASTLFSHIVTDVFWVLVLYQILSPVNKNMASLMVIFSLLGFPISMLNELNNFALLALLHGAGSPAVFASDQLRALLSLFFDLHADGLRIAQIFWGLWLFPYGYLVFKSGFIPRVFGVLLMIGCFGYLIPSFAGFVLLDLQASLGLLPGLSSLGELLVPIWLVIRGVDVTQWKKGAFVSA